MKKSAVSFSLVQLIVVVIAFILAIYILLKFLGLLNYEGRFSCKVGTAVANVFLGPIPDEEKAWQFLGTAALAGTSAILAYEAWKAGKVTYEEYKHGLCQQCSKKEAVRTFAGEFVRYLKEDMSKITKNLISSIGKMSTKTKIKTAGGVLAALSAIIFGKEYLSEMFATMNVITEVLGKIAMSAIKLCQPKPVPIAVDYIQLNCYEFDKYLKEQLTKEAYEALQRLIENGIIEKCSPNSQNWIELFLDIELARIGKMTFEEGLRETELPIPTLHYVVFLENVTLLKNKNWRFGEAEMVCWWKLLRFKGKEDVSYFDEIYEGSKEIYDSGDISSIETSKNLCWKILDELGMSIDSILTNDDGSNYVAPFSDKNSCTENIVDCVKGSYVASAIEPNNINNNSVAVHFYHVVGRLVIYLIYYDVG